MSPRSLRCLASMHGLCGNIVYRYTELKEKKIMTVWAERKKDSNYGKCVISVVATEIKPVVLRILSCASYLQRFRMAPHHGVRQESTPC